MKTVYCDWPECEYYQAIEEYKMGGRCTREHIRMYRDPVVLMVTIEDPPTCSWYAEKEEKT